MSIPCGLGWKPGKGTNPGAYPMRAALQQAPAGAITVRRRLWWANGAWLDQEQTSQCTIYAWLHLLADGPLTQRALVASLTPHTLYQEGQRIDGTPLSDVDSGLSTDAAAQVIRRHGWIGAYHWAATAADIVDAIRAIGPVTFGMDWREAMFEPDPATGIVRWEGAVAGGHQVLLDGVNLDTQLVRLKNSWGRSWGKNGFAYLPIGEIARIMDARAAEACVATEVRDVR